MNILPLSIKLSTGLKNNLCIHTFKNLNLNDRAPHVIDESEQQTELIQIGRGSRLYLTPFKSSWTLDIEL